VLGQVLQGVLWVFLILLIFRMVMSFVLQYARSWRPHGLMVVCLETTYTVTDPPLKFFRRFLPPLRFGGMALDLAFTVLFFVVLVLIRVVAVL